MSERTDLWWDYMAVTVMIADGPVGGPIVNAPNGPYAASTTPVYQGQIVDATGTGIPASGLSSLTLSIVDTLSGSIINGASQVNVLNAGRGAVDSSGNVTITLETGDTSLANTQAPSIQRSLVLDWITTAGAVGRHQVNFVILALAGA